MKTVMTFLTAGTALILTGCMGGKTAWQYYDECAQLHTSFEQIMVCGKESRNTGCAANNTCSGRGNALVQYTESLVASVRSKELSEAKAMRMWIEYRTAEENAYTQDVNALRARRSAAISDLQNNAPKHTSCNTYGTYTSCTSF